MSVLACVDMAACTGKRLQAPAGIATELMHAHTRRQQQEPRPSASVTNLLCQAQGVLGVVSLAFDLVQLLRGEAVVTGRRQTGSHTRQGCSGTRGGGGSGDRK